MESQGGRAEWLSRDILRHIVLYYILSPFSRKLPAKEYEKRTGSECIVAIAHAYTCTPSYMNV